MYSIMSTTLSHASINTNIFNGTEEQVLKKVGRVGDENGEMRNTAIRIALAIQSYRSVRSGVAFSKEESEEYYDMFPSISKTANFNNASLDALIRTFTGDTDYFYKFSMGDAYDELFKTEDTTETTAPTNNITPNDGMTDEEAYAEYLNTINNQ